MLMCQTVPKTSASLANKKIQYETKEKTLKSKNVIRNQIKKDDHSEGHSREINRPLDQLEEMMNVRGVTWKQVTKGRGAWDNSPKCLVKLSFQIFDPSLSSVICKYILFLTKYIYSLYIQ